MEHSPLCTCPDCDPDTHHVDAAIETHLAARERADLRHPPTVALTFTAGERLLSGDFVAIDPATGKLVRCPQGQRYLCVITRDYQAGEVFTVPWSGV